MKVIIKIGYNVYLLPDDKGVATIVKALTRAVECHEGYRDEGIVVDKSKPVKVEMRYVAPGEKIKWPKDKPQQEEAEPDLLRLPRPRSIIIPPAEESAAS